MASYYNDNDRFAADMLRVLIAEKHIPYGHVDERSIRDVSPADLAGYAQCHFFAGIGGWPLALALAGWPPDRPVWTGSCPCQPFSAAGKRKGAADERHLWPEWFRLIRQCRPPVIFGEQVASSEVVGTELEAAFVVAVQQGRFADANGLAHKLARSRASLHFHRRWIDGVRADVEAADYAFRFEVLGAHSVGAPHIRQRLWWVADADRGRSHWTGPRGERGPQSENDRSVDRLEHAARDGRIEERPEPIGRIAAARRGVGGLGDADGERRDGKPIRLQSWGPLQDRPETPWSSCVLVPCADGKARRAGAGVRILAHGVPGRVGLLRAGGNAIVPQVAAEFIRAYCQTVS